MKNSKSDEAVITTDDFSKPSGNGTTAVAKQSSSTSILSVADMNEGIPDMDDMEVAPLDLASTYWTPEVEGESKRLLFSHFAESLVPDKYGPNRNDPDATVMLETAHFYERKGDEVISIRQASKVLLSTLKGIGVMPGTMIMVTYKGKKKLSNGNTGDTWAVYPLKPKAK